MLESIAFSSIGSGTWQNVVAPLEIPWRAFNFLRTPAIRSASISSLGGNLLALPFQWPLLRSLSLTAGNIKDSNSFHLTTTAALLILRQCPNLTTCTICITPDRNTVAGNPDVQPPSLILPHLTDLTVDNREHSQINAVGAFRYQGPLPFNALFSAIHALEDLSIDLKGLTVDAFLHFLELLPSLVQLRLDSGGEYDPWSTPGAQWGPREPARDRERRPAPPHARARGLARVPVPAPAAASRSCGARALADDVV
ncbi:hypothetical protein DFH09DRAFT_1345142 [Mycena vulgaris]|nr:hypothetical protein DFH09DRAFT_1345142 [Mycena vulgaris]